MNFFTILFYFLLCLGIPITISAVNAFAGKRYKSAWSTVRVYLVLLAVYAAFLVATTLALPIQVIPLNEAQYSGDWSFAASTVRRTPHDLDETYEVDFRLGNRGTKPLRGEKRMMVYILTEDGTRYNVQPGPNAEPFDTLIPPGKSITVTRTFVLPTNQNRLELVAVKEGFRMGWFIIGRFPFDGRTVILLQ